MRVWSYIYIHTIILSAQRCIYEARNAPKKQSKWRREICVRNGIIRLGVTCSLPRAGVHDLFITKYHILWSINTRTISILKLNYCNFFFNMSFINIFFVVFIKIKKNLNFYKIKLQFSNSMRNLLMFILYTNINRAERNRVSLV